MCSCFLSALLMAPVLRSRGGAIVAKYGDKSVYFDLEDIGNTTGQWDLYGSDAPSPYNSLQVETLFLYTHTQRSCQC